jgi:hypothetical protein
MRQEVVHVFLRRQDEYYIEQADLNQPLILAEIAPDQLEMGMRVEENDRYAMGYNLMDGHHRLLKRKNMGSQCCLLMSYGWNTTCRLWWKAMNLMWTIGTLHYLMGIVISGSKQTH